MKLWRGVRECKFIFNLYSHHRQITGKSPGNGPLAISGCPFALCVFLFTVPVCVGGLQLLCHSNSNWFDVIQKGATFYYTLPLPFLHSTSFNGDSLPSDATQWPELKERERKYLAVCITALLPVCHLQRLICFHLPLGKSINRETNVKSRRRQRRQESKKRPSSTATAGHLQKRQLWKCCYISSYSETSTFTRQRTLLLLGLKYIVNEWDTTTHNHWVNQKRRKENY